MDSVANRLTLKQNMLMWVVSYGLSLLFIKACFVEQYEVLFGFLFFGFSVLLMLFGLWGVLLSETRFWRFAGWSCLFMKIPLWLYVFWVLNELDEFAPEKLVTGCLYGLILTGVVWGWGGFPQKTLSKGLCK